jgi:hypothetical protein
MTDEDERIKSLANALADGIAVETKLSHKQAVALILKEIAGVGNDFVADVIDVKSAASASSYVTRCRTKFQDADEEIEELEQEIQRWENTKKVESIVERHNDGPSYDSLQDFSDDLKPALMESPKFLIRYLEDGKQKLDVLDGVNPSRSDREIIDYKRINSVDELFED